MSESATMGAGRAGEDEGIHDVIVVGGGAAGLNAALMLARAGRDTLVIDAGQPRNRFSGHMHGYLSRDGLPPDELLALGRAEVEGYGGVIRTGTVIDATVNDPGTRVTVTLDDGAVLHGRRLLLTTGVRDELPPISGMEERWGKDVLHCPYCHGHEVRNQPLGVIATGPMSLHQVTLIRQWSPDLTYFLNGQEPPEPAQVARLEARGIRLVSGRVTRLVVDTATDRLAGVELEDGTVIARSAVFVATTLDLTDALVTGLGVALERNEFATWVVTERGGQTSVPGVWAAGNVAEPMAQVIGAAASGAMAGATINMSLVEEEFDQAQAIVGSGLVTS